MLSREELIVLRHYVKEGLPKTVIAEKLGINRRTVHRYLANGKQEPQYGPRPPRPSKLDPYKEYLLGRIETYPELSGKRLLGEIRNLGYEGGYTILKDYLRAHRPRPVLTIEQRFEVSPGQQAQVDFATFKAPFGTVYALLVVLSWSRALWVRFGLHQDQLTLLSSLHGAFSAFGGVPRSLLFDRMRAVVAGSGPGGSAVFNAEMLRFAAHYGFRPVACRPYRAKTKGRVERAVSYLRRNFFYGRSFRDLEDLNLQVDGWLREVANLRVHGTTGEIPGERLLKEHPHLSPLPVDSYTPMLTLGRRIAKDGFISYNGNEYSVPEGLLHREVQVRATLEELHLLQDGRPVGRHPVLEGRGLRRLAPEHRRHPNGSPPLTGDSSNAPAHELIEVQRRPLEVYERVLLP